MKKKEKLKEKLMPVTQYGFLRTGVTSTPANPNNDEGTYILTTSKSGNAGGAHAGQTDTSESTWGWQHSTEMQGTNWQHTDTLITWQNGDKIRYLD